MRHEMWMGMVVMGLALGACGGKGKGAAVDPNAGSTADPNAATNAPDDQAMVPPESIDEIQRLLTRKRDAVSRCLSIAVDNKELPKNSRGRITLDITVGTSGHARGVRIVSDTLDSKSLEECVAGKIREIPFPTIPSDYETTYVYAFEAD